MPRPSSSKLRHSVAHHAEATHQLLVFFLRKDWFALPLHVVQKVVQIEKVYGTVSTSKVGLALYQDQEIPVIDIEQRVYREPKSNFSEHDRHSAQTFFQAPQFLAIVLNHQGEMVGLPMEAPPTLRRIGESAFAPLPATYLSEGNLRCVGAIAVPAEDAAPIFLLNLNQLLQPLAKLPVGQ